MIAAMPGTQTARSHAAWDPLFHFVLIPIFLTNLIVALVRMVREWQPHPVLHVWAAIVAFAILLLCFKVRMYALADQDRIIRLEERIRITTLAPATDISQLSTRQLIALRFASDSELPTLVQRTINEALEPKAIKQIITVWRPDLSRI